MLKPEDHTGQEGASESPYAHANIFMKVYFCWLLPFLRHGYRHTLEEKDMYRILNHDRTEKQATKLEKEWAAELQKHAETGVPPSLGRALYRVYCLPLFAFGFLATIEECVFKMAQPVLLAVLVQYFGDSPNISRQQAYLCAAGIGLCSVMLTTLHHVCWFVFSRTGMHMRVSTTALVYKKALTLGSTAFQETTVGQIVNLLSNDVNRFDRVTLFLHYLWVAPIQVVTMLAILWVRMGALSLVAISTLMLLIPVQAFMAKMFSNLRAQTAVLTDERVRIMNEIISANKVIKVHGWEESFTAQVKEARRREVRKLLVANAFRSIVYTMFTANRSVTTAAVFIAYAYAPGAGALSVADLILVISLLDIVGTVSGGLLSVAVLTIVETRVTLDRLKQFLLLDELQSLPKPNMLDEAHANRSGSKDYITLDDDIDSADGRDKQETAHLMEVPPIHPNGRHGTSQEGSRVIDSADENNDPATEEGSGIIREEDRVLPEVALAVDPGDDILKVALSESPGSEIVRVERLSGSWKTGSTSTNVLDDISFTLRKGELLAIVGPVGSGKSSLLMALMGELPSQTGLCAIRGTVAYASQQPWLFSGQLRQNVIFAGESDEGRYLDAVGVCALNKDIDNLPEGDLTLVGERGVKLSGGQKARVGLARAVYDDADIYLLDDPLSAVDTTVGRHLFERCIKEALEDKAVILVTHQLQYLNEVDKIIILKEGKVSTQGTYQELVASGVDFATVIGEAGDGECLEGVAPPEVGLDKAQPLKNGDPDGPAKGSGDLLGTTQPLKCGGPDGQPENGGHLVKGGPSDDERKAIGTVKTRVYGKYLLAGTSVIPFLLFLIVNVSAQAFVVLSDWWITNWAYIEEECVAEFGESECLGNVTVLQEFASVPPIGRSYFVLVYGGFLVCLLLLGFLRTVWLFVIFVGASENLHNKMFGAVIRAPMRFFDTNPAGRILNRFAKDVGLMDEALPSGIVEFNQVCVMTLLTVILVCFFNPLVVVLVIPLVIILILTRSYYLASSRDIKRIEAVARSPVFTHLSASLQGLSTIRAYGAQDRFIRDFYHQQDGHTRAWMMFISIARWFSIMLDMVVTVFIVFTALASVLAADLFDLNPAEVGLSLIYSISLLAIFQFGVRQSTEIENWMTSTERVIEYGELQPEGPLETEHKADNDWPKYGNITFEGVSMRYSADGPLVLKQLRCSFRSQEKIGIVGRTGAGKTSLTVALFRLVEPLGLLKIDGEDITQLGLHQLRRNLSYIPQDPVLFRGTLRHNLDPLSEFTDDEMWGSLKEVQLDSVIQAYAEKLDVPVLEGGANFSVGQRQLLCLARAMLRRNNILVIDEATANVDLETDQLIQATVREKFRDCSVLTVAHRLNTIIDADRVLVLEEGKILEFDEPFILLQKEDGFFTGMVGETGNQESRNLWEAAKEGYKHRYSDDPYNLLEGDKES